MSTKIEWCTETWNPVVGCTKVSPGCDHCYAERMARRLKGMSEKYDGAGVSIFHRSATGPYAQVISDKGFWNGRVSSSDSSFYKPTHWKKPRMIFVCSMGDLFHNNVSYEQIDKVLAIIENCPQHTFLILTKRAERMYRYFTQRREAVPVLHNLWLGVTAENQEHANKRVPLLLSTPAAKRFVSVEPLLGKIDLVNTYSDPESAGLKQLGFIDWVICGGESGPGARPVHPDWVRFLQIQCHVGSVPFFFKQWGEWFPSIDFENSIHKLAKEFPDCRIHADHAFEDGIHMYKVGKKAAGSILEGKEYKEYPKVNL